MEYLGLNAEYLFRTGASGNYLPGGLQNYSTQKMITYSDSDCAGKGYFVLWYHFEFGTKVAQTPKKSLKKLSSMQTGRYHPYDGVHESSGLLHS